MLDDTDWTGDVPFSYGEDEPEPTQEPTAGAVDVLPEPQPPRPPLLRHVRELLTNPPAVRWLIRDIVEADTLALLYGQPGAGKSFCALSMAASIACGSDWYGHRVTQGPAVYILGEGGGGVSRRLRAWHLTNPDARLPDAPLFISRRIVPLGESEAVAEITAAIQEAGAGTPSVVFIDTLARAAAGLDENSARDMGELVQACDKIREQYKCSVILVHHAGHNQDRARGSSAIKAALDAELSLTQSEGVITLSSSKAKESEGFKPLTFKLASVDTQWLDEDDERIYSAVLEECEPPEQAEQLGKNQTLCLGVLREMHENRRTNLESGSRSSDDAKVTLAEWREGTGLIRQRFNETKSALIKRGLVTVSGNFVRVSEGRTNANESERNVTNRSGEPERTERNGGVCNTPVRSFVRSRTDAPDDEGENYEEF
ncbi:MULTISPECIES: AAA family ATPase [Acidithiobacillus]|uniref:AAA+ ATPase domain-containing protein n=3 Tax=Acidithiobacillus thiooxidans TaxID=930 RepID=A0A5P9XUG0_ACITH|nr:MULTISPECIES: helicase RepA family protein [Acidithiobacillus]MBU2835194.1 AAA family ATPase [Acidithiobacillus thiooxidans]MDA8177452.1 helicase RepA family protein [Acidithiobacillus sp.]QFX97174.1 hypothetical protein GCD22_03060 [Acidithiobacillus thiooxidans ATCC 19377]